MTFKPIARVFALLYAYFAYLFLGKTIKNIFYKRIAFLNIAAPRELHATYVLEHKVSPREFLN